MKHVDLLLHPQHILTPTQSILSEHTLVVDQGKILALVPTAEARSHYSAQTEYALPKHIVMPGLVNAHTHVSMNLLRGLADDLMLLDWLEKHIWPAEAAVISAEFVKDGALLAMAELIRGGVTCFSDSYFYMDQLAEVVDKVGMRAVLAECFFKFSTPWSPNSAASFERTEKLMAFCKDSATVYPAIFPHSPYATDVPLLEKMSAFAKKHDLLIHTHLLESASENADCMKEHGKRPLALWNELGLIGPKTIAVHMTQVNDDDLALIARQKASVVHCPESNMKLASGICPIQTMLDLGINVALGTDGAASNNDLDMFSEMRSAAFLSKVSTSNPESIKAETALEMATINGAKALHLAHEIGSIEVGKQADLIAIDLDTIETQPCFNPPAQLVYATSRNQVTHVWVNGKILLDERKLTTIDEAAVFENAKQWQAKLKQYAKG